MATHAVEDGFEFADEPSTHQQAQPMPQEGHSWPILLVDDEADVHAATQLALKGMHLEGRSLAFFHAYSAQEARALLASGQRFAVALIDVVMETDDAGLQLVRHIREELGDTALRIVLRTGQPGYAPELQTIEQYDINDYKTKSELTQVRLFITLAMAVRSYAQIRQLELSRRGLEQILTATRVLGQPAGLEQFAQGLVTQLCALLQLEAHCLVCAAMREGERPPYVLAAAGRYQGWMGMQLSALPQERVKTRLLQALSSQAHNFDDGASLFFAGAHETHLAVFVDIPRALQPLELGLLQVFCSNIAVAFENLQLYLDINDLAFTDHLVQLPNRNAMVSAIDVRDYPDGTLALLDLDGFSDINSVLDANFGDAVLQAVARRLDVALQGCAMVARVGGDLFGIYGPQQVVQPKRLAEIFSHPFVIHGGEPLRISATAGLARLNKNDGGVQAFKNASVALKQAKQQARGKALFFCTTQTEAAQERMLLLNRLRAAFSEERLCLYYQPFVDLRSGQVRGAECLLRWLTEDGRFIRPDQFIPLAEQSGLMIALGQWVVATALRWRKSLQSLVAEDFRVAINVSQMQFAEPDFVPRFLAQLQRIGVPGQQVEVELTESVAVGNTQELAAKLAALRAAGVHVAMDDFGTGYSSLSVLQRLDLDKLKIDRSFVSGAQDAAQAFDIAHTIITLAQHLQLATIAEGIETEQQRQALLAAGCQLGQGYLFSRPLPEAQFLSWMAAHHG